MKEFKPVAGKVLVATSEATVQQQGLWINTRQSVTELKQQTQRFVFWFVFFVFFFNGLIVRRMDCGRQGDD